MILWGKKVFRQEHKGSYIKDVRFCCKFWRFLPTYVLSTSLESGIKVMFINFWNFFQGLRSYYRLKRHRFYYIIYYTIQGATFILFFLKFTEATFIPWATFILDSRVCTIHLCTMSDFSSHTYIVHTQKLDILYGRSRMAHNIADVALLSKPLSILTTFGIWAGQSFENLLFFEPMQNIWLNKDWVT